MAKSFLTNLKCLFRFDLIRVLKLLEFCQYGIIGFILGYIVGGIMDMYFIVPYKLDNYVNKKTRKSYNMNLKLWLHLFWDISVIVVATYYIKKVSDFFPFMFSFVDKRYVPGKKGEAITGFTLGLGFIYTRKLDNFIHKMNLLMGKTTDSY